MKECTFQPQTNEGPTRELLHAIMQEDDDRDEDPLESIASASTV